MAHRNYWIAEIRILQSKVEPPSIFLIHFFFFFSYSCLVLIILLLFFQFLFCFYSLVLFYFSTSYSIIFVFLFYSIGPRTIFSFYYSFINGWNHPSWNTNNTRKTSYYSMIFLLSPIWCHSIVDSCLMQFARKSSITFFCNA